MTPSIVKNNEHLIVFDGECLLCNTAINLILKYDKVQQFKFTSTQSTSGKLLLEWCQLPSYHYSTIVYIKHGVIFFKSKAVLAIITGLGLPFYLKWPLVGLKIIPRFIRDLIYDLVASNRYAIFGKSNHCIIQSKDILKRFL